MNLYENRFRYYDPSQGRFTQFDPLLFGGGDTNFYAYVGNNPHQWRDPFGTSAAAEFGSLLDQFNDLADSVCQLGQCVGELWGGVGVSVVTLTSQDPTMAVEGCAKTPLIAEGVMNVQKAVFSTASPPPSGSDFIPQLKGPELILENAQRVVKAQAAVNSCREISFMIEEFEQDIGAGTP